MDIVFLVGRILLAVIFLLSAVGHLTQSKGMAQYAASKGVPAAEAGVIASGVVFALGGIALVLGIWVDLAALALALTLIPVTLMMHAFWKESDAQAKQGEQIHFNKNLALIGAMLILFFFVNQAQDIPAGITGPLFGAW
ncbi:MAG: DoxX family protein [Patulibacter sp.]|nr:DoxX family protein [Patulibacter sp.]